MCEKEFLKFYKKEKKLKNIETAKEKLELFWTTLMLALEEDNKVVLKNWGKFEKKEFKPRKVSVPTLKSSFYTEIKTKIKFKTGIRLRQLIGEGDDYE